MKKIPLHFISFFFFCCAGILPTLAQDDLDINQLRKEAQSAQSNKQGLRYSIVDVQEKDGRFTVKYDLNESPEFAYEVSLIFVRERDQQFYIIPKSTSGAIGEGNFAGRGKIISWDYKKDYPKNLDGDDFYFILAVTRIEPSNFPWTWVGIGTVAAAGATYFILNGSKDDNTTTPSDIPALIISRPN